MNAMKARIAAAVSRSIVADPCVVVIGGVEHRTGATEVPRETLTSDDWERVSSERMIRIPAADLPPGRKPMNGDKIRFEGSTWDVVVSLATGPTYVVELTKSAGARPNARP